MFRLHVVPAHGDPFEYALEGTEVVVGRSSTADLSLADRFLSRRHARLVSQDEAWHVEDLGSRNGTLVNGSRIEGMTRLSPGDEIAISNNIISYRKAAVSGEISAADSNAGHTVFTSASALLDSQTIGDTTDLEGPDAIRRYAEQLRILNDVHRALGGTIDLDDLLEMILNRAFDHLEPEEAVIYLRDADGEYRRAAQRALPGAEADFLYSRTLIDLVAVKGNSARVLDVEKDDRFDEAKSILSSGIRSLVAAPLLDSDGSLGMIALSSRIHRRQYEEEDMELLTSLASVAALRIRNVALLEESAERRRLEEELKLARQIQVGLLPDSLPEIPGYEFHAGNVPSRGVSGDYYQFVERKEGRECVVMVADVSGKGIAASLLTASLEALSAGPIEVGHSAREICDRVCRRLYDRTPPAKYATAFLSILEPETGRITYTNAGHNDGVLVRSGGNVEQLKATGMPVGLMADGKYSSDERTLEPGDTLVLYTDGITEAENPESEEYHISRLIDVSRKCRTLEVGAMSDAIEKDVRAFTRGVPFADDRTLVLVRRTG